MPIDDAAAGFLDERPDPMRYDYASREFDDAAMKLAQRIPPDSRVLDIGCGTGSVTEVLQEATGARIVAIEPDPTRAARARARGLIVVEGFLTPQVIREHGPFDVAVFADVLEHLPNPAHLVSLAKEALRPGGSILASVPNAAHLFVRLDLLRGRFCYENSGIMDATHVRWFTRDSLKRFFERCALEVVHQDYTVMPGMRDYDIRRPFCWIRPDLRAPLLRRLAAWTPGLFSVQHIIEARKA